MRFYLFAVFVLCFNFIIYSQDYVDENNKITVKGEWLITTQIGFATIEAKNSFKVNGTIQEVFIGRELVFDNKSSLIVGVEMLRVSADFNDSANQQLFFSNNHINIPVSYRLFYDKNEKISFFVDIGIYGSYLLKSKVEIASTGFSDSEKGLGFNLGYQASFGAKYRFNDERYSVGFGLKTKRDLVDSYKSSVQEFSLTDAYLFQISFGLTL